MPPTIIRFLDMQDQPGGVSFFLAKPNGIPVSCTLTADVERSPFLELQAAPLQPGAVEAAGRELYRQLEAHNGVKNHFQALFADTSKDPPRPIGMQVDSARADCLPWEALFRGSDFLSLDKRWPVVRLLDPTDDKLKQDYEFVAPLRIAAVLSAWGSTPAKQISAKDEWASLEQGILQSAIGSDSELLVLVCEDDLKQKIDGAGHRNVRAEMITSQGQISQSIRDFGPHILHVFCHGHSGEKSYLRICTAADQASDQDGSIFLLPADLRQDVDSEESVWLVVLNCCDTANAIHSGDVRNLAASLVKAGFPAVIGMREPVESNFARVLTEEFYSALIPRLHGLPNGQVPAIEWAELLVGGRKRLRNDGAPRGAGPNAASSTKHWTIPALYMRTLAFRLRKVPHTMSSEARAEILANIAELREQRSAAVQMNLPGDLRLQMLAAFDSQIASCESQLI